MLNRHPVHNIVFSDEKLFLLQESHNAQNNRIYAVSKGQIPACIRLVERYQNVSSVMVWGAISAKGKLPLLFIDKGVKINAKYYLENVLQSHLVPEAQILFPDLDYCFQQDGAPSHTANVVQQWCKDNLKDFITKDEWPPSSPDLNPLDYCIWGEMLSRLQCKNICNLDQFKQAISQVWTDIPIEVVRAACNGFRGRLVKVRSFKGERFE